MTVEHNNHCIKDIITNNHIDETVNRTATATQKMVYDGTVSTATAIAAAGVAGIKQTTDGITSVNKNVYDGVTSAIKNTTDGTISTTKAVTDFQAASALAQAEARIESLVASGVTNNLISSGFKDDAISAKDIQLAIYKDGGHTRERADNHFVQLEKEILKSHTSIELQAERNARAIELQAERNTRAIELQAERLHAATAAQIAKCCCEGELREKDTQALIIKQTQDRKNDEIMELRFKLLAAEGKIPTVAVAV